MNNFKFTETQAPVYELRLFAYTIKPKTIEQLTAFGFINDKFGNYCCCQTPEYQVNFYDWQPNKDIWDDVTTILSHDETFNGNLEELMVLPDFNKELSCKSSAEYIVADYVSLMFNSSFPQEKAIPCPIRKKKMCDIHINVDWHYTVEAVKKAFDGLGLVSFDYPIHIKEGFNRIYTLAFEDLSKGVSVFNAITYVLVTLNNQGSSDTSGILGFVGEIKLEIVTREYRQPMDGTVMPIIVELQRHSIL